MRRIFHLARQSGEAQADLAIRHEITGMEQDYATLCQAIDATLRAIESQNDDKLENALERLNQVYTPQLHFV